jgi:hypothetical protein
MQIAEARLWQELTTAAADAGPLTLTGAQVAGRVRRRRAALGAAAGVASLAVVAAVTVWVAGRYGEGPAQVAGSSGRQTAVYMCGERLDLPHTASTRSGLSMSVAVRGAKGDHGPDLSVTFTAQTSLTVTASPPELYQVVYLRDGVIVGGGPLLNQPGDTSEQGLDAVGTQFTVGPGSPSTQSLGRRDALCPSLTWQRVWSEAKRYEVVVVQGPIEQTGPAETVINIPLPLDAQLMVARAPLTR